MDNKQTKEKYKFQFIPMAFGWTLAFSLLLVFTRIISGTWNWTAIILSIISANWIISLIAEISLYIQWKKK